MFGLAMATAFAPTSGSAEDFTRPERHFRVEQPAALEGAEALVVYDRIVGDMVAGYVLSRDPSAESFRRWRRYNRTPYRSATHGERFVNNYANAIGRSYGDFQAGDEMPVGSILAKDSFAVTAAGDAFSGPLFLMEKMPADFNPASRNWRYSMIMPDGSYFGVTNGDNAERVDFCITCHAAAGDENDHLFFVPEDNRERAFRLEEVAK